MWACAGEAAGSWEKEEVEIRLLSKSLTHAPTPPPSTREASLPALDSMISSVARDTRTRRAERGGRPGVEGGPRLEEEQSRCGIERIELLSGQVVKMVGSEGRGK